MLFFCISYEFRGFVTLYKNLVYNALCYEVKHGIFNNFICNGGIKCFFF